jgi:GDSL-like Lipase/Acylhydrolase family
MSRKNSIFAVISIILGVVAGLCIVGAVLYIDLKVSEASRQHLVPNTPIARYLRNSRIVKYLFTDPAFERLMEAIKETPDGSFSTVWDFDQGIALSKRMFVPTEMFGFEKYKYRPDIGIYNCHVWSGLDFEEVALAASPDAINLLRQIDGDCTYFETDENGFKKTEFPVNTGGNNVFFLGDSFTDGLWVASKFTFANAFGQKLASRGISVTPINLGVTGYSALEEDWMLEKYGDLFKPIVVIVNLFPNDVHDDYFKVVVGGDIPEQNYENMFYYLQRMEEYCLRRKIQLIVAIIPCKEQFSTLRNFSVFQSRVKSWSEGRHLTFLDPRDYLSHFGADKIYLSWDPHFSIDGHERYADFLVANTTSIVTDAIAHVHTVKLNTIDPQ